MIRPLLLSAMFLLVGCPEPSENVTIPVSFTVTADEAFVQSEQIDVRGEGISIFDEDAPEGVVVSLSPSDEDIIDFTGTLSAGTYNFMVEIEHYADAPSIYETLDVTITSE